MDSTAHLRSPAHVINPLLLALLALPTALTPLSTCQSVSGLVQAGHDRGHYPDHPFAALVHAWTDNHLRLVFAIMIL